jgi:hypothetical protein
MGIRTEDAAGRAIIIRKWNFQTAAVVALLCAMGLAYDAFLRLDISGTNANLSSDIKYAGIALCLILAACSLSHPSQKRDAALQVIALAFTAAADYLLLFTSQFGPGLIIFFGAHLAALYRYERSWFAPGAILAAAGTCLWFTLSETNHAAGALASAGIIYSILILAVTVGAFHARQERINSFLSRAGMVMFLMCDICVAAFNLLPAQIAVHRVSGVLMWMFYLPAQTMLALSARRLP